MQFFGISLFQGKYSDFLAKVLHTNAPMLIFTPNSEMLYGAYYDPIFLKNLQEATHNVPDGNGLYMGSLIQEGKGFLGAGFTTLLRKKFIYGKYGELVKGSDLTRDIFISCKNRPRNILILDNTRIVDPCDAFEVKKKYIQEHMSEILAKKYPGASVQVLFFGEQSPQEIASRIDTEDWDFVLACSGMKKQEQQLVDIWHLITNKKNIVAIGIGASIDFLLGVQRRAPKLFTSLGLEWLYRLILSPRKRFGRIYTAFIKFPRLIVSTKK